MDSLRKNLRPPTTVALERRRASARVRYGLLIAAVAYVGYLALLVTCDLLRVAPLGFIPRYQSGEVTIAQVQPFSIAERAGLRAGDRIRQANGQTLAGGADWQRVRVHLDPSKPFTLEIEREGQISRVDLTLPSGLADWRTGPPRPGAVSVGGLRVTGLLAFRSAQIITLGIALMVAFRRSFQPSALLGALLLASISTVSLVLPMRVATFWNALPGALGLLLWVPFATSMAVGPLLFTFAAVFPRRVWSTRRIAIALVPAGVMVSLQLYSGVQIMQPPGGPTGLPNWTMAEFVINVAYAACAVALLLAHHRAAETLTDERRIRVLIVGVVVGVAAGSAVVVGYWRNPGADIFATRTLTVLSLVFLAVPASFAYAILRHRLFDVSLIVRQGLRYALARRFVDALIFVIGAVLLADLFINRTQPLVVMLQSRWWWFTSLGAILLVARSRREQWLKSVDRRFFRERYDAQRLLRSIADQITRASDFDAIAPSVMQQIDEALHPEFVTVLRHVPEESVFSAIPTGTAPEEASGPLPSSLAVIGVLSVLRKPLALSLGDTAWVRHQLPLEEHSLLLSHGIELLVPICSQVSGDLPVALLALGPRRSEEPYNQEDLDLLVTIAQAVGSLIERSSGDHTLAECPGCGRCFGPGAEVCPHDGHRLTATRGSRLLNGRYCLQRRLGRGGMGTVYEAVDDVLERPVAVKLIREDVVGPLDMASRFRQEARAAAGFAHPNVVRVYDFGLDRHHRPFLVMELLEGETLRQHLSSRQPLGTAEALHILRGVCSAVSAAHGQGLVHRDLKPENIFLQRHPSGVVPKVLDFGLAKTFDAHRSLGRSTARGTSAGLLVGTLEYMAPEQVAGDDVDPGWDIWALGVITYEMLAGRHPLRRKVAFAGDETAAEFVTGGAPDGGKLSGAVTALLDTSLSADPAARPRDALDFLSSCERLLV